MTTPAPSSALQLAVLADEDLALRAQSGSMPCFVELVARFEGRVYNFILRRVDESADAEDLTQETFLRAWQRMAQYRRKFRFSTWVFTIASRLACDHLRARRGRPRQIDVELVQDNHVSIGDPAATAAVRHDGRSLWTLAATLLNTEQHAALWLRYAEDLSIKEVGRVLGRTSISVRVMLFRAREILAAHLRQSQLNEHAGVVVGGFPRAPRTKALAGEMSCVQR